MSKVVGDIAVTVGADVSKFERGMKRAGRSSQKFDKSFAAVGRSVAVAGAAIAVAAAAVGVAGARMASSAFKAATEINNLSRIAGVSAEQFQRYAAAADSVGISQEKLGDIFKDVNDKFGDFMATGAGPLADFFENIAPRVGVTAEQFAKLSGPDALQAYVAALERAGVSQQQMTFYMEALASDATALLPLMQDNARELRNLGDEAQRSGRILSDDMVTAGAELDRRFRDIGNTLRTSLNAAILENAEAFEEMASVANDVLIPAMGVVIEILGAVAERVTSVTSLIREAIKALIEYFRWVNQLETPSSRGRRDRRSPGRYPLPPELNPDDIGGGGDLPPAPALAPFVPPVLGGGGGVPLVNTPGGGGGGAGGMSRDDLEAMQARFAEQRELVTIEYERQLEELQSFREAKLGTEAEYNDLEARIKAEHEAKLTDIEKKAQQARMQAVSGALGDLGALMTSENEKLFKIGKAAKIAEAIVSGYSAAVNAWEKGMKIGGPPVAAAFAGASLAKTGALISSIQSASVAGGGGGAGAAGAISGDSGTATGSVATSRQTLVQITGDSFGRESLVKLLQELNELNDDGAQIRVV